MDVLYTPQGMIPIAKGKHWICESGHEIVSDNPPFFQVAIGEGKAAIHRYCPICYFLWLSQNVPGIKEKSAEGTEPQKPTETSFETSTN